MLAAAGTRLYVMWLERAFSLLPTATRVMSVLSRGHKAVMLERVLNDESTGGIVETDFPTTTTDRVLAMDLSQTQCAKYGARNVYVVQDWNYYLIKFTSH